ncbi:MAG TPA: ABC transporter permease [Blastocatellia bacterium]|nr:ABC transporter permease [Blastocatellia bacterium]
MRKLNQLHHQASAWRGLLLQYAGLLVALLVLIVAFSLKTNHFLSLTTLRTIANQIPDAVLLAVGMTLVMIVGGIDLSVGSVMALSGAVLGVCLAQWHWPLLPALALCLLVGALCGLANGWITVQWKLPSFIVTLGMMEVARGAAYLMTNSQTMYIGARVERISAVSFSGLSLPFACAIVAVIAGQFALTRMVWGRFAMAVGANEEAVRYAGINPRPIKVAAFVLSGLLAACAAVLQCARLSSADPNAGTGAELQAIAACVIGGTSLSGGRGSVVSSFFGVLLIAVLGAGLAQIGAQEPTRRFVTGCVIIAAVILDVYRARLSSSTR